MVIWKYSWIYVINVFVRFLEYLLQKKYVCLRHNLSTRHYRSDAGHNYVNFITLKY